MSKKSRLRRWLYSPAEVAVQALFGFVVLAFGFVVVGPLVGTVADLVWPALPEPAIQLYWEDPLTAADRISAETELRFLPPPEWVWQAFPETACGHLQMDVVPGSATGSMFTVLPTSFNRPPAGSEPQTITMEFSIPRDEWDRMVREYENEKALERYKQYLLWHGWHEFWRFS
jgi:hypothetical protein